MIKGKTESGFEFELDEEVVTDMEFIELAAEAAEDGSKYPAMIIKALGKDQKKRLYDHVRNERGHVPFDAVDKEFNEIFAVAQQKNS